MFSSGCCSSASALVPLHEFEEYGWPGGEPAIMNKVIQPSDRPDRYPLNQNSAMIVNVAWYPFALVALVFQHQIWLGLGTLLFWVGQFVIHGIVTNLKRKTVLQPGLADNAGRHRPSRRPRLLRRVERSREHPELDLRRRRHGRVRRDLPR